MSETPIPVLPVPQVPATDPLATGAKTSEGKLALSLTAVAGAFGVIAPIVIELSTKFPGVTWLSIAAMVVGWGVSLFTALGYIKARTVSKVAMIQAESPPMAPVVKPVDVPPNP